MADPQTGQLVESVSMLTQGVDAHPLMSRMHRPDPKRAPHLQDKRSVVPIEAAEVDLWLFGTVEQARELVRRPAAELLDASPAPSPRSSKVG